MPAQVTSVTAGRSGVLLREPPSLRAPFFATTAPAFIFTALLQEWVLGLERGSCDNATSTAAGAPREGDSKSADPPLVGSGVWDD